MKSLERKSLRLKIAGNAKRRRGPTSQDCNAMLLPIAMTMKAEVKRSDAPFSTARRRVNPRLFASRRSGHPEGSPRVSSPLSDPGVVSRGSRRGALNPPAVICQKRRGFLGAREKAGRGERKKGKKTSRKKRCLSNATADTGAPRI